jgi:hypothetical protein
LGLLNKQTPEQKKALFIAYQSGVFREIANSKGATGYKRKPLSENEKNKRKVKRKLVKLSRKTNRKTA